MRKIAFSIILFTFYSQKTEAQQVIINANTEATQETFPENYIYRSVEKMPEYPGGINKFKEYLVHNFNFPEGITESVRFDITFIVEKDGSLSDIKLSDNLGLGLAEEIQRIFASSLKWTPGYAAGGKPVRTHFRLPLALHFE